MAEKFETKLQDLANRTWDNQKIADRINKLVKQGIPEKSLNPSELKEKKVEIQNRVRQNAEEYNFILHNCAQSTALALMEEFGLGSIEQIKALTAFPGIGGSGRTCGGITGSLIAFGLHFGSESFPDVEATGTAMFNSQNFLKDFENEFGYLNCADIQERVVFGKNMDPGANEDNMAAFAKAKGFEKCSLVPGISAFFAAGHIIDAL